MVWVCVGGGGGVKLCVGGGVCVQMRMCGVLCERRCPKQCLFLSPATRRCRYAGILEQRERERDQAKCVP